MNTRYNIRLTMLAIAAIFLLWGTEGKGQEPGEELPEPVVTHTVELQTSLGQITIDLFGKDAPKTVANFLGLIDSSFYPGILFHRVHPGFLVQTGDPKTKDSTLRGEWGTGGYSIYGGPFADELDPKAPSFKRGYRRGAVAMANRGPNTNTSQFFIILKDVNLPQTFTIFGYVRDMATVDRIAETELVEIGRTGGKPKNPISIVSVTTVEIEAE